MIYPEETTRHSGISVVFGAGIGVGRGTMDTGGGGGPVGNNGIWLQTGGPDFLLVATPNSFLVQS